VSKQDTRQEVAKKEGDKQDNASVANRLQVLKREFSN
jgi:hypothetical protein